MMRTHHVRLTAARLAIAALAATGWTAPLVAAPAASPTVLRISGSSTVYPLVRQAVSRWQGRAEARGVKVQLSETGTGAGLRDLCQGRVAIANASRPINSKELRDCQARGVAFLELPIAFDAITVVVNPRNTWAKEISTVELSRLWGRQAQGRIRSWRQVNLDWPDRPIKLCGPGRDSGTFDYFNKAINGDEDNSRTDFTASEQDDQVIRCVAEQPGALGYLGFDRYQAARDRLKPLAIDAGRGPVAPSVATVQKGSYTPLARPMFIYINAKALRSQRSVKDFVTYTVRNGLSLAEAAGAVPLPSSTYQIVESKLYNQVLGTSFGGSTPVGLSIGEALRRSFDQNRRPQFR